MKKLLKPNLLPYYILAAGGLGAILRIWLTEGGMDEKGLLIPGHPALILLFLFTAAAMALLFLTLRSLGPEPGYHQMFPASLPDAVGNGVAAVGVLILSVKTMFAFRDTFARLSGIIGLAAAASLAYTGWCRLKKLRPSFLFHGIVTGYFMVHTVAQYRIWGSDPQWQLYFFPLLACIFLMLCGYHRTALDLSSGSRKAFAFCNQAALFFCLVSLWGENWLFYLSMAIWNVCNIPSFKTGKQPGVKNPGEMYLPEAVRFCIRKLEKAGFEAYAVGGCVRDHLLGLQPHDYDLCTSATPEETAQVFSQYSLVRNGEKHGTIGVILKGQQYEITTFRSEGGYTDGRHPDWVNFVSTVQEDLSRRDFTVNAMAYAPGKGIIDPWGGKKDLQRGILRAVGDPEVRFREDSLRILRGVRFAVRFGLIPERDTEKAMEELAPLMDGLARERVFGELCKLLPLVTFGDMQRFAPILTQVIPELKPMVGFEQHSPHHAYDLYTHTAHVVEAVPNKLTLRWAALLHDIGKVPAFTQDENGRGHFYGHAEESAKMADDILRRLKAPNALREQVVMLIAGHMLPLEPDKKLLRRRLGKFGKEAVYDLLTLQKADFSAKGTGTEQEADSFTQVEVLLAEIAQEDACLTVADLALNGRDILALGAEPGPHIGACMTHLLTQVQDEILPNDKTVLLDAAKKFLREF